jgi:hypothetical protein
MLTQEQIQEFKSNGYLRGGRVLSDEQVDVLRDEVARIIRDRDADTPQPVMLTNLTGDDAAPVWQIVNIWEASEPFRELIHNETINQEMAQLTGASTLRIWHDQIQFKPPNRRRKHVASGRAFVADTRADD